MGNTFTTEEWFKLILKHDVIGKLNDGEKFSSINIDLGLEPNSDALRKALNRLDIKKIQISRQYGFDFEEEFLTMVLLQGLEKHSPINIRRQHLIKYMKENESFSEAEISFVLESDRC
ncbi:hypothetical protein JK636_18635 [Clostridium sp. YIM B02515]|uniref:Uncharacterized protein n=1 Tax=Clostridium rhizosphaerae TaxID=2803861 RepID=A0ABS1TED9_9CLOT|nr:hypothetical protein [Clostridium rhizosphaerae]MBL4937727.1 hypothetical protein [Clostridium rhizosphaerae]